MFEEVRELLAFVDDNAPSLCQAIDHIAETNEANASQLDSAAPAVGRILRESAESWRRMAARLSELCDSLPEDWADR